MQQPGEAQDDDHEGGGGGEVERGGGEEGDAQDAHGAPAQLIGRRGQCLGFIRRAACQDDGGDPADTVQEAHLQACHGQELPARGLARADAGDGHGEGHEEPRDQQHEAAAPIRPERRDHDEPGADHGQGGGRDPARVEAVHRLDAIDRRGRELGGMARAQGGRAEGQQRIQHIVAQAAARRRAMLEAQALDLAAPPGAQYREERKAQRVGHDRRAARCEMQHGGQKPGRAEHLNDAQNHLDGTQQDRQCGGALAALLFGFYPNFGF